MKVVPLPGAELETQPTKRRASGRRSSSTFEEHQRALAHLPEARVASAEDKELLENTSKGDICAIKVLGEGAFGIVDLVVVDKGPGAVLLCVRKKLLKQSETNVADPAVEVEQLEACAGCPFVVQMWNKVIGLYDYTLLMEYCPYGSLDRLLQYVCKQRTTGGGCMSWLSVRVLGSDRTAGFSEHEARFFIACALLGVEAMHKQGIIHRDLKPANLLISERLYIKLGDLGLAKRLGSSGKAFTTAGTPCYMAPEVVHPTSEGKSKGYEYSSDIWSLGMTLWELVDGRLPRWAPMSWYFTTHPHFPSSFSQELQSLLSGMLHKEPEQRLSAHQIRAHPWFKGFDWQAVVDQSMEAPDFEELHRVHVHKELLTKMNLR